jgi:hypothetical protein
MAENKKSFLMYADLLHTIEHLPDEVAGKLLKLILDYVNDKDPQPEELTLKIAFEPIKRQLKRDLKNWNQTLEGKKASGAMGSLKRWNPDLYKKVTDGEISLQEAVFVADERKNIAKNSGPIANHSGPNGAIRYPMEPLAKIAVNDNVTVNVNGSVNNNTPGSLIEVYFTDLPNSSYFEQACRDLACGKDKAIKAIPEFRKSCRTSYKEMSEFADHFKNWYRKVYIEGQSTQATGFTFNKKP